MICPNCDKDEASLVAEGNKKTYHCKNCKFFFVVEPPKEGFVPYEMNGEQKVTKTSKEAYKNLNLTGQRQTIYQFVRTNPNTCIREISDITGIQKSSISPRMNELKEMNEIKFTGTKTYKGIEVETWGVK